MLRSRWSRDMTKYYHFHKDHGHNTNDCHELRHQIDESVKLGQLSHLVKGINKGKVKALDTQQGRIDHILKRKSTIEPVSRLGEITFPSVSSARNSSNPVIIKAQIFRREVNRVYMDSGSACEVIYENYFLKLKSSIRSLRTNSKMGIIVSREHSQPIGEVPLEITISNSPCLRTEALNFIIVRSYSLHNLLLGRTAMQKMGIIVSTIFGDIKFHTLRGISTVFSTYKPEKTVIIGKELPTNFKEKLRDLLRSNVNFFSWTHADMMGVPRTIMVGGKPFITEHQLNEYKHIKPVKQKKRWLGPDRRKVACKEVEELMKAGIIREVKNPTWVANPVMVKKADGGWRMILTKVLSRCLQRAYVDEMVIKSISKEDMLKDIQETLDRFRLINMKLNLKKCSFGVEEGPFLGHLITKQGIRANPSKVKAVTDLEPPGTLKDVHSLNRKLAAVSHFLSKGAEKSLPFFKALKSCTDKKTIHWTADAEEAFQKLKKFMEILPTLTTLIEGKVLVMYLAASAKSISVVLLARREEGEVSIYFMQREGFEEDEKILERKTKTKKENLKLDNTWKLYTDGASSFDGSGAGLMLISPEGKEYTYALCFEFKTTKNEAEYKALLAGLRIA
ncbi:reverse transcriptase domain-containing protein [Tanacetum coccineum]